MIATRMSRSFVQVLRQWSTLLGDHCPRCGQCIQRSRISTSPSIRGIWEPDNVTKAPAIPEYDTINVKTYSFDCAELESFSSYMKSLAAKLQMDSEVYAMPSRSYNVKTFQGTAAVKHKYDMEKFERVLRINNLQSPLLPVFLEMLRKNAPPGVEIIFKQHTEDDNKARYVTNHARVEIMAELDAMKKKKVE